MRIKGIFDVGGGVQRTILIGMAVIVFAGCRGPAPSVLPSHHTDERHVTTLTIETMWAGVIRVEDRRGSGIEAQIIRDDDAYGQLIARLPEKRIQMRQPAPPSSDPLRARPAIDFSTHMLVVVVRTNTLERPVILHITCDDGHVIVTHDSPPPPPAARPDGFGGYTVVKVRRVDGDLLLTNKGSSNLD